MAIGINIIPVDTDAEARRLATSQQMSFVGVFRGSRDLTLSLGFPAEVTEVDGIEVGDERAPVDQVGVLGSRETALSMSK